ncbi:MAG: TonB-dependent siderophore receptor [Verrucomicrobiota bacterium]
MATALFVAGIAMAQDTRSAADSSPEQTQAVNEKAIELSPFTVTASATNTYLATNAASGTRIALPLESTPLTISVVTADLLKDKGLPSVNEAIRFMPGVRRNANNSDQFKIRGFQARAPRVDDFYDAGDLNEGRSRYEMAEMERIELIKGPTSVLFGFGNPGGVLNMITKRPLPHEAYSVTATLGSWDQKRIALDATGPIAKKGDWELLYRLIAVKENAEGFRDFEDSKSEFASAQLQLNYRNTTSLRVRFRYHDIWEHEAFTLMPYDIADGTIIIPEISYNVSGPLGDFAHLKQLSTSYEFTHKISSHLHFRAAATDHEFYFNSLRRIGEALIPDHTGVNVVGATDDNKRQIKAWQMDLTGNWDFSAAKLKLVAGANATHSLSRIEGTINTKLPVFTLERSTRNYTLGNPADYVPGANDFRDNNMDRVYYALTTLQAFNDRLTLLAAVGRGESDTNNTLIRKTPPTVTIGHFKITKPQFGASYELRKGLFMFANMSESAAPNVRFPGTPEEGKSYDVGFKFNQEKFAGSVAYFHTTRSNIQVQIFNTTTGLTSFELSGEEMAEGVETDFQYFPTKQLQVVGTYAWTNSRVVSDAQRPGRVGTTLPDVPRNAVRLWSKYTFSGGALDKVWVGAGYLYTSQMIGNRNPVRYKIHVDGWQRFDASIGYTTKMGKARVDYVLNAENLLDKDYIDYMFVRGRPFNLKVSATVSF